MKPRLCDHNRPAKALTTGDPPTSQARLGVVGRAVGVFDCNTSGTRAPINIGKGSVPAHARRMWMCGSEFGMYNQHGRRRGEDVAVGDGVYVCRVATTRWRWLGMPHLDRGRTWVEWSYNWRQLMIVKDGTCRTETVRSSSPGGVDVRSAAFSVVHVSRVYMYGYANV